MKARVLDHFDLWLKLLLKYFNTHTTIGKIFFFEIGLSILFWSIIVGVYTGQAIYDCIHLSIICR